MTLQVILFNLDLTVEFNEKFKLVYGWIKPVIPQTTQKGVQRTKQAPNEHVGLDNFLCVWWTCGMAVWLVAWIIFLRGDARPPWGSGGRAEPFLLIYNFVVNTKHIN